MSIFCQRWFWCICKSLCPVAVLPTRLHGTTVLQGVVSAPLPVPFTHIHYDECNDSEGSTRQGGQHQELEAEDQALLDKKVHSSSLIFIALYVQN